MEQRIAFITPCPALPCPEMFLPRPPRPQEWSTENLEEIAPSVIPKSTKIFVNGGGPRGGARGGGRGAGAVGGREGAGCWAGEGGGSGAGPLQLRVTVLEQCRSSVLEQRL